MGKNVGITFDDGYRDYYYKAYPILKKFNVPATIFLSTAYIDKQIQPWLVEVRFMFMKTKKEQIEFSNNSAKKKASLLCVMNLKNSERAVQFYMMKLTNKQRCILIDKIYEDLNVNDRHEIFDLMLNWNNVIDMANNGINFGAHTENHPVMSNLSLEYINKEILNSKERIGKNIKKICTLLPILLVKGSTTTRELFQYCKN